VSELSREEMKRLARLGAQARLQELRREESAIRQTFPELFRGGARRSAAGGDVADAGSPKRRRRRRSRMSPAERKAVSERMKKYWAERRKSKGAK
jgi:hypothetical protein